MRIVKLQVLLLILPLQSLLILVLILILILIIVKKTNSLLGHFGYDESMSRFSLVKFLLGLPQQSDKQQIRQLVRLNTLRETRLTKVSKLVKKVIRNTLFFIGIV